MAHQISDLVFAFKEKITDGEYKEVMEALAELNKEVKVFDFNHMNHLLYEIKDKITSKEYTNLLNHCQKAHFAITRSDEDEEAMSGLEYDLGEATEVLENIRTELWELRGFVDWHNKFVEINYQKLKKIMGQMDYDPEWNWRVTRQEEWKLLPNRDLDAFIHEAHTDEDLYELASDIRRPFGGVE